MSNKANQSHSIEGDAGVELLDSGIHPHHQEMEISKSHFCCQISIIHGFDLQIPVVYDMGYRGGDGVYVAPP